MKKESEISIKYLLLAKNPQDKTYLDASLEYNKEKLRYDEDIAKGKKLRRQSPTKPNSEDFTNIPSNRFFAMKEIELLGVNFTPLFEEYEHLRCLKANCDIGMLKHYSDHDITVQNQILLIIPTELELRYSKAKKQYYKLHIADDYGSQKYVYLWNSDYKKFKDEIVINEPLMILVDVKLGSASLKHARLAVNIPQQKVDNIRLKTDWETEKIITKYLYDYIGGDTEVIFNNKQSKFHINISYKLLKELRNLGYNYELNVDTNYKYVNSIEDEE